MIIPDETNPYMEIDPVQARQQFKAMMVNADEVVREKIDVKVRMWEEKPVLLDDGKPLLDKQGKPRMYRECVDTRTAHIQNLAPIDIYAKATAIYSSGVPTERAQASEEQIMAMGDVVWQVWTISEPWMEREDLLRGGIDGDKVFDLFTLFFEKVSRQ